MKGKILITENSSEIRNALKGTLEQGGYKVTAMPRTTDALTTLASADDFGVWILDVHGTNRDIWAQIRKLREAKPRLKVIVVSDATQEKTQMVHVIKSRAADYFEKPLDSRAFTESVQHALKEYEAESYKKELILSLEDRVHRIEGREQDRFWFVSKSKAMEPVNEWLTSLRRESMRGTEVREPAVLLQGELGSGVEGLARMIHAGSRRGKRSWVAVNCRSFADQELERELLGYEKGAFEGANSSRRGAFEIAKGGTVFLEEIGAVDSALQGKLVRLLQDGVYRRIGGTEDITADVRLIVSTTQDLKKKTEEKRFREDLLHRLGQVTMTLPPLRECEEDIVPLATQFALKLFRTWGKSFEGFDDSAIAFLTQHSWPGNAHELYSVMERLALGWKNSTGRVRAEHLSLNGTPSARMTSSGSPTLRVVGSEEGDQSYTKLKKQWCDSFEKEYLLGILKRHHGNVSAAARESKLDRSNFLRLLRRHGLKAQAFRDTEEVQTTEKRAA